MVDWTPEQKREYERGVREDYAEFCEQHRIETKGKWGKWVPVPMIGLTGFSLNVLAKRG